MTPTDKQRADNEQHYLDMMRELAQVDPNLRYALVPGSALHARVNGQAPDNSDEN